MDFVRKSLTNHSLCSPEDLLLGDNYLVGSLPSSLAEHASSLRRLSLFRNSISGALPLLTRMSHLVEFDLSETLMRGAFPTEDLDHLTALEVLNLQQLAQVTGALPPSIASMTNLRKLYFVGTSMSGIIPESMGEMISLGKFSASLWRLFVNSAYSQWHGFVEELAMGVMYLTGTIPTSLGNLASLSKFLG